jgi:hypothetical protein
MCASPRSTWARVGARVRVRVRVRAGVGGGGLGLGLALARGGGYLREARPCRLETTYPRRVEPLP